jgi:hypothetical protein
MKPPGWKAHQHIVSDCGDPAIFAASISIDQEKSSQIINLKN